MCVSAGGGGGFLLAHTQMMLVGSVFVPYSVLVWLGSLGTCVLHSHICSMSPVVRHRRAVLCIRLWLEATERV
jgi:hypothetical protein